MSSRGGGAGVHPQGACRAPWVGPQRHPSPHSPGLPPTVGRVLRRCSGDGADDPEQGTGSACGGPRACNESLPSSVGWVFGVKPPSCAMGLSRRPSGVGRARPVRPKVCAPPALGVAGARPVRPKVCALGVCRARPGHPGGGRCAPQGWEGCAPRAPRCAPLVSAGRAPGTQGVGGVRPRGGWGAPLTL